MDQHLHLIRGVRNLRFVRGSKGQPWTLASGARFGIGAPDVRFAVLALAVGLFDCARTFWNDSPLFPTIVLFKTRRCGRFWKDSDQVNTSRIFVASL